MTHRVYALFRNLFHRSAIEHELDEELRATVDLLTQERMRQGLSEPDAHREALILLGGLEQVKEKVRAVRIGRLFEDIGKDVRYCLRTLRRDRVFASTAVITMALGIGALTSVFALFDAALLQPLPYEGDNRLVAITDRGAPYIVSYPYYQRLREQNRVFAEMGLCLIRRRELKVGGSREPIESASVTASLLRTAKTAIIRGRLFTQEEDRVGGQGLALISASFWKNRLDGQEDVIGEQLDLDGIQHTIIGILPDSYAFPADKIEVWTSFHADYGGLAGSPRSRFFRWRRA
jgi:hypothetical protein